MTKEIRIGTLTGDFAENKDTAKEIRINEIIPTLSNKENIILNFKDVNSATQSFIHALLSDVIRKFSIDILEKIEFKNCNDVLKRIIRIVTDYMQEID